MDPRVVEHFDGDISRANIQPQRRDRYVGAQTSSGGAPLLVVDSDVTLAGRVHRCTGCGYAFDEERGDLREGFPPGTRWAAIPDDWCCPDCGVRDKADFIAVD